MTILPGSPSELFKLVRARQPTWWLVRSPIHMGMPTDRPYLRAAVDEDTRDRWHEFAARHGVSVSALIEALGQQLDPTATKL